MEGKFLYNPKSHQPDRPKSKLQRNLLLLRHGKSHLSFFYYFLKGLPKTLYYYKKGLKSLYPVSRDIPSGFCLSTGNEPELLDKLLCHIIELKPDSLLLRIPVWSLDSMENTLEFIREITANDIEVIADIIQGQDSVNDLSKWQNDLDFIFGKLSPYCRHFIIGHAFNRVKWGIMSGRQYLKLFEKAVLLKEEKYNDIRLIGPSVIDFEYIHTLGCLNHRKKPGFDMVNQLLYVDRRGAPENRQNGFDLAHKCLLFRSIIDATLGKEIPFWITETNYPLLVKEEEYCPTSRKEAVDEDHYASYMVRYYIIALASGCVGRVYWWQTAAHGYGLIDNISGEWRKRKAYYAFLALRSILGSSMVIHREINERYLLFRFRTKDKSIVSAAWAKDKETEYSPDINVREILDITGKRIDMSPLVLSHSPLYLIH